MLEVAKGASKAAKKGTRRAHFGPLCSLLRPARPLLPGPGAFLRPFYHAAWCNRDFECTFVTACDFWLNLVQKIHRFALHRVATGRLSTRICQKLLEMLLLGARNGRFGSFWAKIEGTRILGVAVRHPW